MSVFENDGTFLFAFGETGQGDRQFDLLSGIAVGDDGRIYVVDRINDNVQVFENDDTFLFSFGSSGTGDGQFDWPHGLTLDADANILVVDPHINHPNNARVQVFDSLGVFQFCFGQFGSGNGQFDNPISVAVDNNGLLLDFCEWETVGLQWTRS